MLLFAVAEGIAIPFALHEMLAGFRNLGLKLRAFRGLRLKATQYGLRRFAVAMWHAACVGAVDEVARILDADPSPIDARGGWFDWEPLLYAAYSRLNLPDRSTLATARLLVERGANPDACYMWGGDCRFTALTGAFGEGEQGPVNQPPHPEWEEFARLLLDAGADPNDGQALYNRMFSRDDRCLEMLLEYGLNCEHRINWRSGKGWVLDYQLHWAVRNNHVARAKLLVEHGARGSHRSGT